MKDKTSSPRKWGQFRYTVVGPLLSSPPDPGGIGKAIEGLAAKVWKHPITGDEVRFAYATIEGWYYRCRKEKNDPIGLLNRKTRKDRGQIKTIGPDFAEVIESQYGAYPWWTVQLHAKNLRARLALAEEDVNLPSYSSILRFMRSKGMQKLPRPKVDESGQLKGLATTMTHEISCFEVEKVNQIWSRDFHEGKLRVMAPNGLWIQPVAMGIIDHGSRLACHVSWGLHEDTISLVSNYQTAVMKRGRPRKTIGDNGAAMRAEEFVEGLKRLGIDPVRIRAKKPNQNGKTEVFWNSLESELVAMLLGQKDLTLDKLNKLTQAWVEGEYNRRVHRETNERPIDRFQKLPNVGLKSLDEEALKRAFRIERPRTPRRSDGTIRIDGHLFRLPQRFQHLHQVSIRYARWDLGFVHLIDQASGQELDQIYPVDKVANTSGQRRAIENPIAISQAKTRSGLPPMLVDLVKKYESLTQMPLGIDHE